MSGARHIQCDTEVPQNPSEAEAIRRNLRSLRAQIVTAWRERAVLLSPEEQADLHAEIKQTCDFLTDLTQNP